MLYLTNTLTRKKEEFTPLVQGSVTVYSCGPTVYWFCHIGNLRSFLFSDILCRVLELLEYHVTLIMNITDVGHLVGDGDDGEDKILVAMRKEGKTAYEIAEFYTRHFFDDSIKIGIKPASNYPRATQHILEQIELIQKIEKNGFTYITRDGIYFDTSKLPDYGKLSGQKSSEKQAGARVAIGEKKHATDFALWKFTTTGSGTREMEWDSPWGKGFPGWHIECSAMSKKYLGVPFDIHTGGIDHIPVHHENELAQTAGADGVLEAHVWMHNEFITVDGSKMSKSLSNFITLNDIIEKGFHPLALRFFYLSAHYRQILNFTWDALSASQQGLYHLYERVLHIKEGIDKDSLDRHESPDIRSFIEDARKTFIDSISDDLNTPQACAVLFDMLKNFKTFTYVTSADRLYVFGFILECDKVLGLAFDKIQFDEIPEFVHTLFLERNQARATKDWKAADELRKKIQEWGFQVQDSEDGSSRIFKISIAV